MRHSYSGRWTLDAHGKKMMLLITEVHGARLSGSLTEPRHYTENWLGEFVGVSSPIITVPVTGTFKGKSVKLTLHKDVDKDTMTVTLRDRRHLMVDAFHGVVPPWTFVKIADGEQVHVATDWPPYDDDPDIVTIRDELRRMAGKDKAIREKQPYDSKEAKTLADSVRPFLEYVFDKYGWPRISMFDVAASNDFWLLVQHEPLAVQITMLPSMKAAADEEQASKANYAYLFDRVQALQGKPQYWGTQSRCEEGKAIPFNIIDRKHLDLRRRDVGLGSFKRSLRASEEICRRLCPKGEQ
jgi:hypothetical protein